MPYAALRNMSLTAPGGSRASHQEVSHAGQTRTGVPRPVSGLTALTVAVNVPDTFPCHAQWLRPGPGLITVAGAVLESLERTHQSSRESGRCKTQQPET